jgi:cysteine synthase
VIWRRGKKMKRIFNSIDECIGNTPVIKLKHSLVPTHGKLFLKLEEFNPTFSIKDRTAVGLIKNAFQLGNLKPGGTVIESTSGNLGKSLAMLGAILKFKVILVVDPKISSTMLNWYKAYGAEIVMIEEQDKHGGYQLTRIKKVKSLLKEYKNAFWPNQYDNKTNPNTHYLTTALEIAEIGANAVIGTVSTGGHLCGIARNLKENHPTTAIVACDVEGSAIFKDNFKSYLLNGVGLAWRSKNTNLDVLDFVHTSSDQEAISVCRLLARETGLLIGGSGGLAILGALTYLNQHPGKSALAIIPDSGVNYLDQIYNDKWLLSHNIALLNDKQLQENISAKQLLPIDRVKKHCV